MLIMLCFMLYLFSLVFLCTLLQIKLVYIYINHILFACVRQEDFYIDSEELCKAAEVLARY